MGTNYHNEALRKQRMLERMQAARERSSLGNDILTSSEKQKVAEYFSLEPSDNSQSDQRVQSKRNYRLSPEGFNYRFHAKDKIHVDRIYKLIYPGNDNIQYKDNPNRANRIQNQALSKYQLERKVNGPHHVQPITSFPRIDNKKLRKPVVVSSEWRPNARIAMIERDSMHQLMHPYDFSTWEKRKSLGLRVVDGTHYYRPRPKEQIFKVPYYSSEPVHSRYTFNLPDQPLRHRKVDNTSYDQVKPLMSHPYTDGVKQLPPRRKHVKV